MVGMGSRRALHNRLIALLLSYFTRVKTGTMPAFSCDEKRILAGNLEF